MTYHVVIPGTPIPQGSSRAFVRGGRAVVTSANPRLRSWRLDAAAAIQAAMDGRAPLDGPISVRVFFYFARPDSHYGKRGLLPSAPEYHTVRPDLDKLVRAILDALTEAGAIRDDSRVASVTAWKGWTAGRPGALVTWMTLDRAETAQAAPEAPDEASGPVAGDSPVLGHPGAAR